MAQEAQTKAEVTVEAVITRADGTVERLGAVPGKIVGPMPEWLVKAIKRIRGKQAEKEGS